MGKNELLKMAEKLLAKYNESHPEDKKVIRNCETFDVSKLFVCLFDDNRINLFSKSEQWSFVELSKYEIFRNKNYTAILDCKGFSMPRGSRVSMEWYKEPLTCNCYIEAVISFDDLRLIMYSEGLITQFERGRATEQEKIDVLSYARQYFEITNKNIKQRTK